MNRVSVQMTISLPPMLYKKAMDVAEREIRSKSELVREALRDYIAKKKRFDQLRTKAADAFRRRGIRSLGDVERMVDQERE